MTLQIKLVENIDQMIELSDFFNVVWADGPDVVSFDLGYALIHVGGYASLAYQDDVLVGASFWCTWDLPRQANFAFTRYGSDSTWSWF